MNEVKILGENINIAERENFESGNDLLNFNTCEVSVLSIFLSLLNKDSCSYAPKIRVIGDQMGIVMRNANSLGYLRSNLKTCD